MAKQSFTITQKMCNSCYVHKKIEDVLAASNDMLANWENCPMMKSVEKR